MEIQSFTWFRYVISICYILSSCLLSTNSIALAKDKIDQKVEDKKIYYLINEVKKSNAIFIRNGDEHNCKEAAEHLESKMKKARRSFGFFGSLAPMNVETFIDKIASQSSMSGKAYQIKFPNQKPIPSKTWMYQKLKAKFPKKETK